MTARVTRRWVLKGLGAAVSIPVLPSLLTPSEARAQAAAVTPFFVGYRSEHGGAWAKNMFPSAPAQGVEKRTYAGREIRRFALSPVRSGTQASLSPILSAKSTALTDAIVAKMYSLQGLDIPFYSGHQGGGSFGNFAAADQAPSDVLTQGKRRTIDQVMAWSPSFYDLSKVRQRAMIVGDNLSYNYANPAMRTGEIQKTGFVDRPIDLFNALFPQQGNSTRKPIVDKVLDSYRTLRSSSRISVQDKARLDDHIQRLSEVQRRLTTTQVSCGAVSAPSSSSMQKSMNADILWGADVINPRAQAEFFGAVNDVIALALTCGVSRIALVHVEPIFSTYAGDWHHQVAHLADGSDGTAQRLIYESYQLVFENVVLDLANKLNAIDAGNGQTLLDQGTINWTQESGNITHNPWTLPVVGFGGASGFFATGSQLDYRDLQAATLDSHKGDTAIYPGLLYHQYLGSVLQAMRIPKSEWENAQSNRGYPDFNYSNATWGSAVWSVTGDVLPWLKQGS